MGEWRRTRRDDIERECHCVTTGLKVPYRRRGKLSDNTQQDQGRRKGTLVSKTARSAQNGQTAPRQRRHTRTCGPNDGCPFMGQQKSSVHATEENTHTHTRTHTRTHTQRERQREREAGTTNHLFLGNSREAVVQHVLLPEEVGPEGPGRS